MLGLHHHHSSADPRDLLAHTIATENIDVGSIEQYRALALALERAEPKDAHRVLVVTSALAGEGKTLTVTNLGYTLSRSYRRRVLIVDGDLRRPRLHTALASLGTPQAELPAEMRPPTASRLGLSLTCLGPTLFLLSPATAQEGDPVKTLNSPDLQELIAWARERFEWVLIDSPPAALMPDAAILSQAADGVLFLVLAGSTPAPVAARALANIGRERVIGIVMNRVPPSTDGGGGEYYDSYERYAADQPR